MPSFGMDDNKQIDFVLVYTESFISSSSVNLQSRCDDEIMKSDTIIQKHKMRQTFERNLEQLGCCLEREPFIEEEFLLNTSVANLDRKIERKYFLKIHASFQLLLNIAERTKMRLPIAVNKMREFKRRGIFDDLCSRFKCFEQLFALNPELFPNKKPYFTEEYQNGLYECFKPFFEERVATITGGQNGADAYFTIAERSKLLRKLLSRCPYVESTADFRRFSHAQYDDSDISPTEEVCFLDNVFAFNHDVSRQRGLENLILMEVYDCAFPLHEPLLTMDKTSNLIKHNINMNTRTKLYYYWVKLNNIFRQQPYNQIREYFGERIAFYFAWLGWYNFMLIFPSIIGIAVMIYGLATLNNDTALSDICDLNKLGNLIMCPRSDKGNFWYLRETCSQSKFTYVFDNAATIGFACVMSLWSILLLCLWERKQNTYRTYWDVHNLQPLYEMAGVNRPDYERRAKCTRVNPITKEIEPHVPFCQRFTARTRSCVVVLFMVFVVCSLGTGVIVYRLSIKAAIRVSRNKFMESHGSYIISSTGALINLCCILLLSCVYERVALYLTNLEFHKTDIAYEDSLTLKLFVFQFVNYYSSLFYIALFKPSYTNRPGSNEYLIVGKYRSEECDFAGCMNELVIQLVIILVGKQLFSNIFELAIAKLKNVLHRHCFLRSSFKLICKRRKLKKDMSQLNTRIYESDLLLQPMSATSLFYEYLELAIQYGFIVMLIVAFPLAPLFSLINNIFEVRVDARKFLLELQRPVAQSTDGIGIWYYILRSISRLGLITNSLVIAFTSDTIQRLVYRYAYSPDGSLKGYVYFTLSRFNVSELDTEYLPTTFIQSNITECWYRDFRYPPEHNLRYEKSLKYYHVTCVKLAFVIVFECLLSLSIGLIDFLVAKLPSSAKAYATMEQNIVQNIQWAHISSSDTIPNSQKTDTQLSDC